MTRSINEQNNTWMKFCNGKHDWEKYHQLLAFASHDFHGNVRVAKFA